MALRSAASQSASAGSAATSWLREHGPKELELLFRALVYRAVAPVLVADNDRNCVEASLSAGKLLGFSRHQIVGRKLDDAAGSPAKPRLTDRWQDFLATGEQQGQGQFVGRDGIPHPFEYSARGEVLPDRHLLAVRTIAPAANGAGVASAKDKDHLSVPEYATFLLDPAGSVAAWYGGAARLYQYSAGEAIGRNASFLHGGVEDLPAGRKEELDRSLGAGHFGQEGWHIRKDASRFWANVLTVSLRDEAGELRGFARLVRNFSERHEQDERVRQLQARLRPNPVLSPLVGVAAGEFDQVPEINNALLNLLGYSREDVLDGRLHWPDLTPAEYFPLDELAQEECLRFGACTPYEKELLRKDGSRTRVLVATAVLSVAPFRWVTFVHDLLEQEGLENPAQGDQQGFEEMIGSSAALRRAQKLVGLVAPTDATVLILGETGTGKELVARALHRLGPRRNFPFITLNCAAIPTGLLESELFGYERGAFTGALSQKIGRFEMAHRGTLFLDEVGDIPLDLQPKLLRALQEKAFERLGGTRTIPIDVRLIAATNRNLTQMMGDNLFRSDLYYRLKVFPILTPSLRDRPEDIPILAWHFTRKYAAKMDRTIDKIPVETMLALVAWPWPGNVRELENLIERSVILSSGATLRVPLSEIRADALSPASGSTLEQVEREHILRVLRESKGVVTAAAIHLGLHRTTLNAMMRKLNITRSEFQTP